MDSCVYMAEFLCCSLETITTLLIGYISIQNKNIFLIFNFLNKILSRLLKICIPVADSC